MTCQTFDQDLSAHLDGELSGAEERRLLDHLAICPACRAARDELARLSAALREADEAPSFSPAEEFEARLVRRAGRFRRGRKIVRLPSLPFARIAAAALFLVIAVVSGLYLNDAVAPATDTAAFSSPDRPDYSGTLAGSRARVDALVGDPGPDRVEVVRLGNPGDRIPPLPSLPLPSHPASVDAPTARTPFEILGLSRIGELWLTEEAYQRMREHREQERLLARSNDLRERALAESPPTRADENAVVAYFGGLTIGTQARFGDFKVVPILDGDGDAGVEVLEARDALRRRILLIREDRSTARLTAVNTDKNRYVFLPAGAVLVGGHQDRMVTRATLIPPNSKAALPVLCCEKGRYVGARDTFTRMVGIAPPEIRGLLLGAVDQDEVWSRIDEVLARLGVRSRTRALREIFLDGRGPEAVRKHTAGLRGVFRDERSVGFLVFEDGRFVGGEVFASHEILEAEGGKFVASYVLGEIGRRASDRRSVTASAPADILAAMGRASFFPTPGAVGGQESEFVSEEDAISGTSLIPVAGARPLHVFLNPGVAEPAGANDETGQDNRVDRPGRARWGGRRRRGPRPPGRTPDRGTPPERHGPARPGPPGPGAAPNPGYPERGLTRAFASSREAGWGMICP